MYGKQIAVVSANPIFSRFFEFECRLLGNTVRAYTKMPSHAEEFDCIFVDTDTVRHYVSHGTRYFKVSKNHAWNLEHGCLPWPITMEQIHRALEYTSDDVGGAKDDTKAESDMTFWIQNRERREIRYKNQILTLSASEFLLLVSLANEEKKPVSRETLLRLYGADGGNIADVYVCHLRKKLEGMCERRVIETVRGVGYRLIFSLRETETE